MRIIKLLLLLLFKPHFIEGQPAKGIWCLLSSDIVCRTWCSCATLLFSFHHRLCINTLKTYVIVLRVSFINRCFTLHFVVFLSTNWCLGLLMNSSFRSHINSLESRMLLRVWRMRDSLNWSFFFMLSCVNRRL